jgi:hypothetical protein
MRSGIAVSGSEISTAAPRLRHTFFRLRFLVNYFVLHSCRIIALSIFLLAVFRSREDIEPRVEFVDRRALYGAPERSRLTWL